MGLYSLIDKAELKARVKFFLAQDQVSEEDIASKKVFMEVRKAYYGALGENPSEVTLKLLRGDVRIWKSRAVSVRRSSADGSGVEEFTYGDRYLLPKQFRYSVKTFHACTETINFLIRENNTRLERIEAGGYDLSYALDRATHRLNCMVGVFLTKEPVPTRQYDMRPFEAPDNMRPLFLRNFVFPECFSQINPITDAKLQAFAKPPQARARAPGITTDTSGLRVVDSSAGIHECTIEISGFSSEVLRQYSTGYVFHSLGRES